MPVIYQTAPIAANLLDIQPHEIRAFSRTLEKLVDHWPSLNRSLSLIQVVNRRLRFTLDAPIGQEHLDHLDLTQV